MVIEEVKGIMKVGRESHARCVSNNTRVGWTRYTGARKQVKNMVVENEKGMK